MDEQNPYVAWIDRQADLTSVGILEFELDSKECGVGRTMLDVILSDVRPSPC